MLSRGGIRNDEEVTEVRSEDSSSVVTTADDEYTADCVVLAVSDAIDLAEGLDCTSTNEDGVDVIEFVDPTRFRRMRTLTANDERSATDLKTPAEVESHDFYCPSELVDSTYYWPAERDAQFWRMVLRS